MTPKNRGQFGCPAYNQATKIIARFGGEARLAKLLNLNRITVYRWNYVRPYGRDGLIPTPQVEKIKAVARLEGIVLLNSDWVPDRAVYDEETLKARDEARAAGAKRPTLEDLLA